MKYIIFKTIDESGIVESDATSFEIVQSRLGANFTRCVKITEGSQIADTFFDLRINDEAIKKKVIEALELSDWVQKDAAKLLGIEPITLCRRCAKFDITHKNWYQEGNKKPRLKIAKRRMAS